MTQCSIRTETQQLYEWQFSITGLKTFTTKPLRVKSDEHVTTYYVTQRCSGIECIGQDQFEQAKGVMLAAISYRHNSNQPVAKDRLDNIAQKIAERLAKNCGSPIGDIVIPSSYTSDDIDTILAFNSACKKVTDFLKRHPNASYGRPQVRPSISNSATRNPSGVPKPDIQVVLNRNDTLARAEDTIQALMFDKTTQCDITRPRADTDNFEPEYSLSADANAIAESRLAAGRGILRAGDEFLNTFNQAIFEGWENYNGTAYYRVIRSVNNQPKEELTQKSNRFDKQKIVIGGEEVVKKWCR